MQHRGWKEDVLLPENAGDPRVRYPCAVSTHGVPAFFIHRIAFVRARYSWVYVHVHCREQMKPCVPVCVITYARGSACVIVDGFSYRPLRVQRMTF